MHNFHHFLKRHIVENLTKDAIIDLNFSTRDQALEVMWYRSFVSLEAGNMLNFNQ